MLTPEQCRAARAWLEMRQDELADAAGVHRDTISNFERDRHQTTNEALADIKAVLEAHGIEFTFWRDGEGIRYREAGTEKSS